MDESGSSSPAVTIRHGFLETMRPAAIALYEDAFGPKFAVAIPRKSDRLDLLSASLNLDFAFGAVSSGRLVGLAGYKTEAGAFTDRMTVQTLTKNAGAIRGTWAALVFGLYERTMKSAELLMDGIVVEQSARGMGIGTRLLDAVASFAQKEGFDSIRLDVIDTNADGRRMYERNSCMATKTKHFAFLRWFLGFRCLNDAHAIRLSFS